MVCCMVKKYVDFVKKIVIEEKLEWGIFLNKYMRFFYYCRNLYWF